VGVEASPWGIVNVTVVPSPLKVAVPLFSVM